MLIVLGSVNADMLFKVAALPRPGETVLCPGYTIAPGGKGANQAAAAAKAQPGTQVHFFGNVGGDAHGEFVKNELTRAGVELSGLEQATAPTAVAVIGVDGRGENSIIVASGANLETRHGQVKDGLIGEGTTLLCQNEIRPEETAAIIARGKSLGARTILNLAPAGPVAPETLDALDVLIVNEIEARMAGRDETSPMEALARRLATEHDLIVVVTLGRAGAKAFGWDQAWHVGAMAVDAVDTTGAGDTFSGVLAAALDKGTDLPTALHRAAVAAALSCEAIGAQSAQPGAAAIDARLHDLAPAQAFEV